MATAIYPLNKIQLGIESTKGTLVAATRLIEVDGDAIEEQDFYRSAYPQGVRSNAGGLGVITRKGFRLEYASKLTSEEILWPLMTGVRGGVTPTGAGAAKTWVWTPQLTTGIPTLDTATIEALRSDGTTNHYYGEAGYGLTSGFDVSWAFNQTAEFNSKMFGRARQTDTPTGSLAVYSTRKELITNLLAVYLDTTWAGLGGTQLTGVVRSAKLSVDTGIQPNFTMDARADIDFVNHKVGNLTAKLSLLLELDAVGAARFTAYRANSGQFIRLKNTGDAISGGGNRTFQVDGAFRFVGPPAMQRDGEQMLVACELESYYDATGTKTLEFTVINELATI